MKNFLMILLVALGAVATAQIQTPASSSAGSVSSVVGLTDVKIDYYRPKMKGRKIFGEAPDVLLANGKIWRTGANDGTKITFSEDVKVEGTAVPKGTYMIFTWPGTSEWTVALNKDLEAGEGNYDAAKDAAKFKVKVEKVAERTETLTIAIGDISEDNTTAKVQIVWENTSVKFTVVAEYDSKVMSQIENNSIAAARYYFDNKKDLKQALKWADEYLANEKHSGEFWNFTLKARIQKALGDKAGALASAQKSLDLAKKASNDSYTKQDEDLIKSLK